VEFLDSLVPPADGISLNNGSDTFMWRLTQSGNFTVKSMYADLMNGDIFFSKIPMKFKNNTKDKDFHVVPK
jgi:hypothetical protein